MYLITLAVIGAVIGLLWLIYKSPSEVKSLRTFTLDLGEGDPAELERQGRSVDDLLDGIWGGARALVGICTFIGSWVYCIYHFGYLFGVGLGWLPSLIVAVIAAFLWPVALFAGLLVVLWFLKG